MAYDTQVVECVRDEHEGTASADAPPRERWSWTAWSSAATAGVLGVVAVCIVVSAITVVSRQPFGDTGVVLPTIPVTTPTAPPPPRRAQPRFLRLPPGPPRLCRRATYPRSSRRQSRRVRRHRRRPRSRAAPIRRAVVPGPVASTRRRINRSRRRRPIFSARRGPITSVCHGPQSRWVDSPLSRLSNRAT